MESQPLPIHKWLLVALFCAALIGFADSAYLTAQHVRGVIPPCSLQGCERVLASVYASVGPLPTAALGMLFYGALVLLLVAYVDSWNKKFLHWFCWSVSAGFLASLFLVYLQVFVIHGLCQYCLLSALMTTLMFVAAVQIMYTD